MSRKIEITYDKDGYIVVTDHLGSESYKHVDDALNAIESLMSDVIDMDGFVQDFDTKVEGDE